MQPKKLYVWSCLIHCKTLKKQLQNVQEQQKKQSSVFFWRGALLFRLDIDCFNNQQSPWRSFLGATLKMGEKNQVYFVKQLLHHQRDLGGPLLYRAKAWQAETVFTKVDDFSQWLIGGVDSWDPYERECYLRETLRIPNHHRAPNHQLIISCWLQWKIVVWAINLISPTWTLDNLLKISGPLII